MRLNNLSLIQEIIKCTFVRRKICGLQIIKCTFVRIMMRQRAVKQLFSISSCRVSGSSWSMTTCYTTTETTKITMKSMTTAIKSPLAQDQQFCPGSSQSPQQWQREHFPHLQPQPPNQPENNIFWWNFLKGTTSLRPKRSVQLKSCSI